MSPAATEVLDFPDNRLLPALFGDHDRNLALIETRLDITLTPRGNRLVIAGAKDARAQGRAVLTALYQRLESGLEVGAGDVEGVIRMVDEAPAGAQITIRTQKRIVTPRSPGQVAYLRAIADHELVFGLGPAGTGKTYLAVAAAVSMLLKGEVDRLVLSRPAVEAGERLGFLPGDMREKIDPYLRPLYDALFEMMPGDQVARKLTEGEIEVAPLAFMRGRTLSNAFVILDEAQNTTPVQMKMLLTRLGENSRIVVTGDPSQVDLPMGARSGLADAIETLGGIAEIAFVRFGERDVVRHHLVTRIVQAYNERDRGLSLRSANRKDNDAEE